MRPGTLPDFPDSEVSKPMYCMGEPQEGQPPEGELVRLTAELPWSEIQDEALRTELRGDGCPEKAPLWLDVEDEIMEERMREEEQDWIVREWLKQTIQPQDSVSVCDQEVGTDRGEPIMCAKHRASNQLARERMWKHAQ